MATYEERAERAAKLYRSGKSASEVGALIGVSKWTVYRYLKELNLKCRIGKPKFHTLNERYWDGESSSWLFGQQAYWLGFLAADGSNIRSHGHYAVQLVLQKRDRDHLEKFKLALETSAPIYEVEQDQSCGIAVHSKYLSDRLLELGIPPRKSYCLQFPNFLSQEQLKRWLRGYFDGDGSIFLARGSQSLGISFAGTKSVCIGLKELISKVLCGERCGSLQKTKGCFTFSVGGNIQVPKVMAWVYGQSSVYLERKRKHYEELLVQLSRGSM